MEVSDKVNISEDEDLAINDNVSSVASVNASVDASVDDSVDVSFDASVDVSVDASVEVSVEFDNFSKEELETVEFSNKTVELFFKLVEFASDSAKKFPYFSYPYTHITCNCSKYNRNDL